MTAATGAPVRHRTPRATSAVPLNAARLLRVELRRNTMPWILPLIAALFWFDSYRPSTGASPQSSRSPAWHRRGPPSGWPEPPRNQRTA